MAIKTAARFTIDVDQQPRRLVSVRESEDNDLYITINSGDNDRSPWVSANFSSATPTKIGEQRYSVHPSLDLSDKNVIKRQLLNENRQVIACRFHHTRAIKSTRKFAWLYFRRSPHLGIPKYVLRKTNAKYNSLGSYRPTIFTLVYGLFVGPRDLKFSVADFGTVNCLQHQFRNYSLTFLWWFLMLPSHNSGFYRHYTTEREEIVGNAEIYNGTVEGFTAQECLDLFVSNGDYIKRELIEVLRSELVVLRPDMAARANGLARMPYVPFGDFHSLDRKNR